MRIRTNKGATPSPLSASPEHTVPVSRRYGTKSPAPPTRTVPAAVPSTHARAPCKLANPQPVEASFTAALVLLQALLACLPLGARGSHSPWPSQPGDSPPESCTRAPWPRILHLWPWPPAVASRSVPNAWICCPGGIILLEALKSTPLGRPVGRPPVPHLLRSAPRTSALSEPPSPSPPTLAQVPR